MTQPFTYVDGATECRGAIALPAGDGKAPGVAIFADITGIGDQPKAWADRIAAELGFVALAADVYGEGLQPPREEGRQIIGGFFADRPHLRARAGAALDALRAHPRCDGRLAAIGFCFGGSVVLELARGGAAGLAAAVSFHGGLATSLPAAPGGIVAKLLVCHGAEDPMTAPELPGFLAEMAAAKADCQTIAYTGVVHGFTNPAADGSVSPAVMYDEVAARRSYAAMMAHFNEVFG